MAVTNEFPLPGNEYFQQPNEDFARTILRGTVLFRPLLKGELTSERTELLSSFYIVSRGLVLDAPDGYFGDMHPARVALLTDLYSFYQGVVPENPFIAFSNHSVLGPRRSTATLQSGRNFLRRHFSDTYTRRNTQNGVGELVRCAAEYNLA